MLRKGLAGAGALLVLFHVWLLAGQAWEGQLADAGLLARWAAAGALIAGLNRLRRQGVSLVSGRRAVAIWALAALLHGPALAERAGGVTTPAVPEVVATIASVTLAGVAALGLLLLLAALLDPRRTHRSPFTGILETRLPCRVTASRFLVLAPRPPPAA